MKNSKRIIFIILLLFGSITNVFASTKTFDRNELENHGVNKHWTINEKNIQNVMKTPAVDSSEAIYDFSDVLTDEEEQTLKARIDEFRKNTNMELVIVTKELEYSASASSYCYNEDVADKRIVSENEEFASDFYDYNDFGMDNKNYTGILLFRNTAIDPCFNAMFYDMYTFGDAQLYFSQYRYDYILDGIYDDLHNENYLAGFMDFIQRTEYYVIQGKDSEFANYYVDDNGYLRKNPAKYEIPWGIGSGISAVITFIIMLILIKKNKMVKKASKAEVYLDRKTIQITNRQDIFLHTHTSSYTTSSSSGGGGGGHSSHSGSSGGGHSSGGGRHG